MATYKEMVDQILDWSNRDSTILPNTIIKKCIEYAVDNAYRTLRISPMEEVVTYDALTENDVENFGDIVLPNDLIEFIQVRRRGDRGSGTFPVNGYDVYNSRTDIQSFYEDGFWKWGDDYVFTKERNKLRVFPCDVDDIFELVYYKRFYSPGAFYNVTASNLALGNLAINAPDDLSSYGVSIPTPKIADSGLGLTAPAEFTVYNHATGKEEVREIQLTDLLYSREAPNWLLNENEKVILFGALAEAFDYLDDVEQAQKYHQRFELEIARLNEEDKMRMGSGGNLQQRYTAYGLI